MVTDSSEETTVDSSNRNKNLHFDGVFIGNGDSFHFRYVYVCI